MSPEPAPEGAEPRLSGIHHLVITTRDLRAQIEFFTDVLGGELVGLYEMPTVPGAMRAFIRLGDGCLLSFVDFPRPIEGETRTGVTHAGNPTQPTAAGTMQHLALSVDSFDDLIAMRDRIRAKRVPVFGHVDHGFCQSISFAGPEGLVLEIATSPEPVDPDRWIDPAVVARLEIEDVDLERYRSPESVPERGGAVPQPGLDPSVPNLHYPPVIYARMLLTPDERYTATKSNPDPPVDRP